MPLANTANRKNQFSKIIIYAKKKPTTSKASIIKKYLLEFSTNYLTYIYYYVIITSWKDHRTHQQEKGKYNYENF